MINKIYHSLPVQLLVTHIKKNQVLLLLWLVLFAVITQNFGKVLGIPYLFLDPEYLYKVTFWSYFVVGLTLAAFTMSFHIVCYILDGPKFPFLATLTRPFTKFCVNNSLVPIIFLITYIICIILFQQKYEYNSFGQILIYIGGLLSGFFLMQILIFAYFRFTNKDIFLLFANNVNKKLKKIKLARANIIRRLKIAKQTRPQITYYLDINFKPKRVTTYQALYDKETLLKVFDQNHLNMVIIELVGLAVILFLGVFREWPIFQIPAAASGFLLLTIILMFTGALSYWLRTWTITVVLIALIGLNATTRYSIFQSDFHAFGLDYNKTPVEYSLQSLEENCKQEYTLADKKATLEILKNWRAKFPPTEAPKMVFICTSGGGQRAALWTMRALQSADSLTNGDLMKHTMLITGASGGMVGAGYFRELILKRNLGEAINPYSLEYLDRISRDNLNPIILSLLVNDLFVKLQQFEYNGKTYIKERGYAFEQVLNMNTEGVLDKPLNAYEEPEQRSLIPMMILAPNITNDGRKLYISPQHVSYMNKALVLSENEDFNIKGIDFLRLFNNHGSEELRFLSALRMSASFPYITPNISLPSNPPIITMDAGIADNFGIQDAVRFLYVFKDWIAENTGGVVFISIRDSEKEKPIEKNLSPTLFEKFFTPIRNIYKNWTYLQDIHNDNTLEFAHGWFNGSIDKVDLQYIPRTIFESKPVKTEAQENKKIEREEIERASLNWHLTTKEKRNILDNIHLKENQEALKKLQDLLGPKKIHLQLLTAKTNANGSSAGTGSSAR